MKDVINILEARRQMDKRELTQETGQCWKPTAHSQKLQRSKLIWAAETEKGWGNGGTRYCRRYRWAEYRAVCKPVEAVSQFQLSQLGHLMPILHPMRAWGFLFGETEQEGL